MRLTGLEPARPEPIDPKSIASTNFATGAFLGANLIHLIEKTHERVDKSFFKKAFGCFNDGVNISGHV